MLGCLMSWAGKERVPRMRERAGIRRTVRAANGLCAGRDGKKHHDDGQAQAGSGRSRVKKPGMRTFNKNVARARSACSGGKAATVPVAAARACGKLILSGDARRIHGDPGDLAEPLGRESPKG